MANRILAVDDDPVIRNLVKDILTSKGYSVVLAESGEKALELLSKESKPISFSLFIFDIVMPGMTGLQLLGKVKGSNDTSSIPVLVLTGEDQPSDIMAGYSEGADYYITKPFTKDQLLYGVNICLGIEQE